MKLLIDIPEDVFVRLFDNGEEDVSVEDQMEINKAIRDGRVLKENDKIVDKVQIDLHTFNWG